MFFTVTVFTVNMYGKLFCIVKGIFLKLQMVKPQCMKLRSYSKIWVKGMKGIWNVMCKIMIHEHNSICVDIYGNDVCVLS